MRTIYRDIVGAFIFTKDDRVLLGKSSRGTYEGCWITPGGGVEEGETLVQALHREILEETGIDLSVYAKVDRVELELTGESRKILKETGEEVLGKYTFFNYIAHIDKDSSDIKVIPDDDFVSPRWHLIKTLSKLKLPPPTITSLKHLGLL